MLLVTRLDESETTLPSPEALKYKIMVKAKVKAPTAGGKGKTTATDPLGKKNKKQRGSASLPGSEESADSSLDLSNSGTVPKRKKYIAFVNFQFSFTRGY